MKYYIYNPTKQMYFAEYEQGMVKNIKDAAKYTQREIDAHDLDSAMESRTNTDFTFKVPVDERIYVKSAIQKKKFRSSKVFDGFSTVFRQHKAEDTHCRFLHGYGISFKVTFEGELDERNWVWDFGGMKRAKTLIDGMQPKAWMDYMFDHTTIIAEDDPELTAFMVFKRKGIIQLRVIPATGAERFAQFIYEKLNAFVKEETDNRVEVIEVEFSEHGKNAAAYRK